MTDSPAFERLRYLFECGYVPLAGGDANDSIRLRHRKSQYPVVMVRRDGSIRLSDRTITTHEDFIATFSGVKPRRGWFG